MNKMIKVKEETYNKLKEQGVMGDSFDDVISRLIKYHESTSN